MEQNVGRIDGRCVEGLKQLGVGDKDLGGGGAWVREGGAWEHARLAHLVLVSGHDGHAGKGVEVYEGL